MSAAGRMAAAWRRWVDYCREEEGPEALALGRVTFGLAVVANALEQLVYSGVVELYADPAYGGVFTDQSLPTLSLYHLLPQTAWAAWALGIATLVAGLLLTVGLYTRAASVALALLHITLVGRMDLFNFSSDTVFRVYSALMVVAPAGAALSLDAAWRGRGRALVPAWPRRLLVFQLAVIYVVTGLMKVGSTWSFGDGFSALYYALNLPYFARWSGEWAASVYPLTQVATLVTRAWETLFFLVPLSIYLRRDPTRGGPLRRALARWDLRGPMLALGAALHACLVGVMKLGLFPFVMVSLYPFCLYPHEARRVWAFVFKRESKSGN